MSSVPLVTSMNAVQIDVTSQILTVVQLLYGLPSFVLMWFLLILLGVKKESNYKNSFYRLVQVDLLTNIVLYANTWIAIRLEKHPYCVFILEFIESLVPGLLTWSKYLPYWFNNMQFLSSAVLNVHRISSVLFPLDCEQFWSRYYPLVWFGLGVYSWLPRFLWDSRHTIEVYFVGDTLTRSRYADVTQRAINVTAIISFVYFILTVILGIATTVSVSNKVKAANQSNIVIKRKLTKIALTYCIVYAFQIAWTVLNSLNSFWDFFPEILRPFNSILLVVSSDMMTLALPWILVLHDGNVKKEVCRKKPTENSIMYGTSS